MSGGSRNAFKLFKTASLLLAFGSLLTITATFSQDTDVFAATPGWEIVGGDVVANTHASDPSIALDDNGTPYVSYKDGNNNDKATVKKFDGSNWVDVGAPGISDGTVYSTSLAFSGNTLYIAYVDNSKFSDPVTVKKFDGSNWVDVGGNITSDNGSSDTFLAIVNGVPHVAFSDGSQGKITVEKFDGNDWVGVGSSKFSTGWANNISMTSNNGKPYVSYRDNGLGGKVYVEEFDGSNWSIVGSGEVSSGAASSASLAFSGGVPYVAYTDSSNGSRATVKKLNGGSWVAVGSPLFSPGTAYHISLAFSGSTPYVAFNNGANNYRDMVMKFNGNSWVYVGNTGLSTGEAGEISLKIKNGVPFIFVMYDDGGSQNNEWYPTVLRYDPTSIGLSNAESSKEVNLSTPIGTEITCSDVSKAGNDGSKDNYYSYPLGLVNFCFDTDSTDNVISLTFETDLMPAQVVARKYNPNTKTYNYIPGASITETTVNGKHALKLTYTVTDNGPLDLDPTVGKITDPVGLGLAGGSNAGAPNTGLESRSDLIWPPVIVGGVILLGFGVRRLEMKKLHNQ